MLGINAISEIRVTVCHCPKTIDSTWAKQPKRAILGLPSSATFFPLAITIGVGATRGLSSAVRRRNGCAGFGAAGRRHAQVRNPQRVPQPCNPVILSKLLQNGRDEPHTHAPSMLAPKVICHGTLKWCSLFHMPFFSGGGAGQGLATFSKGQWAKNKAHFFFGAYGSYGCIRVPRLLG